MYPEYMINQNIFAANEFWHVVNPHSENPNDCVFSLEYQHRLELIWTVRRNTRFGVQAVGRKHCKITLVWGIRLNIAFVRATVANDSFFAHFLFFTFYFGRVWQFVYGFRDIQLSVLIIFFHFQSKCPKEFCFVLS